MQLINEMKLEFLSKTSNEAFARVTAAVFVSQIDPTVEEIEEIKTAVSEAVTNAIIHGYGNEHGIVIMKSKLYQDKVIIEVTDTGKGIEDIEKAREPLYTSRSDMERSGMGFTVMESFMDELEVFSEPGKGTRIVMVKQFSKDT
jgi:stage II sporulation protein AB (anti-sigma F factor)